MKSLSVLFLRTPLLLAALLSATQLASAASDTWTGNVNANWNNAGNWTGGNAPPQAGDSLIFGSSGQTTLNNDLTAGTAFDGITFSGGSAFTLNGNSVLLSGTNANTTGIANNSGSAQVVGTMPLTLDWGYYTFSSSSGGSVALNGGLTLNAGGVAYFDPNVTSSSLANDSSGLISGLGGAGLTYSGSAFTGLAAMSGTAIGTYSGWPSVVSSAGPIGATTPGAAVNIELTGTAAGNYTFANGAGITYANTIFLSAASGATLVVGSTAGAQTLDLGAVSGIGGIYLPAGNTVQAVTIGSGASTILTAGPETGSPTPGTIVFAINGTTSANQALNNSTIKDNLSGGAVTVVKTGTGSMYSGQTLINTYSGGTYVLQGQLQGNIATSFGTGPIYVAAGATAYLAGQATGTYVNDLYISPGNGTVLQIGTAANPGAIFLTSKTGSSFTYSGTFHLLGARVTLGTAGCRITGNGDATTGHSFNGQITGTGTLDFSCSPHATTIVLNNQTANANNWQGGLIIEELLASPSSARNEIIKLGADNQIPHGASAGDVTLYEADTSTKNSVVRLDLNGHNNTINGLNAFAAGSTLPQVDNFGSSAASVLTLGDNNASGTFNGITSDTSSTFSLGLVKIGGGTQTFTGVLGHRGNTTVNAGTFALSGSATMASSPIITVASPATFDVSGIGGFTVGAAQTLLGIGTVNGSTVINGTVAGGPTASTVGILTNNGDMTFNGGGTNLWNISDATGAAGVGYSQLSITGSGLIVGASSGSPFTIRITGTAANWNNAINNNWILVQSANTITPLPVGAFAFDTSSFGNSLGAGTFSVRLSTDSHSLVLVFTAIAEIPLAGQLVNQTNNAGTTAHFTVTASGAALPATYQWFQGSTPLSNGPDPSGSGATIAIVSSGNTSTLTIGVAGVQDADAGGYTVTVTDHLGAVASSSATLTVIDPPTSVNVAQSANQSTYVNGAAGGIITLSATASGTTPLTYVWSRNGTALATNTTGIFDVNVSQANAGTYTVMISNQAGSATNSTTVITPVTEDPNQIVYEPFNYTIQTAGAAPWTAFGVTNVFNQATGVGLSWLNSGTATAPATLGQDMRIEPGFSNPTYSPNGDSYPWPGLAGNSPQEVYCNVNSFVRLPLGTGGSISSGTVYFSCVIHIDQGSGIAAAGTDYLCGFGTGTGITPNTAIYIKTPGDDTYLPGIFKTSGGTGSLNPTVNGDWSTKAYHRGQIVFVIARLTINPGADNDTFDLWLAPTNSSCGASETSLPTPDVTGVGSSAADVGNVDLFYIRDTAQPFSRRFTDLRIGTTWASVTPPSAPTLSLANVVLAPGVTNAVFASQNAGNPVTGGYTWQFDGGPTLTDGPTGHGSTISGSSTATLTITGATVADIGTYTVMGSNTDPSNDGVIANRGTLTGSASATLTFLPPPLSVAYSAPDIIISWPTNWTGFTLEQTTALNPSTWTTNSLPPYPVVGTNYTKSVNAASGTKFFRLIQ